jgi:NADPH:quinone reductase-like Zn-dependent oxidoreductase
VGEDFTLSGLRLGVCDVPEPGPGEIRVRIQASSINYVDYCVVTGKIPSGGANLIPMTDGAGLVDEIGEGVEGFNAGDLVVARFFPEWDMGGFVPDRAVVCGGNSTDGYGSQYVVRPASWFTRAPSNLDAAQAATLGCAGLTAWRALFVEAQLKPGDWVLTQGTGGVSVFALQFAKVCGARVIATTSSPAKADRLRALGADHVLNYRDVDWGTKAFQLADGRGADIVVEIGGGSALGQSFDAVRYGGCIGLIGILSGMAGEIPSIALMMKNARLQGITVGNQQQQLDMVRMIESCGIEPVISSRFPLAGLADAFREQESQSHFGKIVVDI